MSGSRRNNLRVSPTSIVLRGEKAPTITSAVMLTAVNSDLTGQILGQVRENVYDSEPREHLLMP